MRVHFIGGPAHGRTENYPAGIQPIIRIPRPRGGMVRALREGDFPTLQPNYDVLEYRVTKRTARYAIAEWEPPQASVEFVVELDIDPEDRDAQAVIQKLVYGSRDTGDVHCIAAEVFSAFKMRLTLQTLVEGPEDAVAIQLGAEKVQNYLDSNLPGSVQNIRNVEASARA